VEFHILLICPKLAPQLANDRKAGERSPTGVWTVEDLIDAGFALDFFERNAV